MKEKLKFIVQGAAIAAIYTVMSVIALFSVGPFQIRIAEALTVLPWFVPSAIPGLAVGCLLSGLLTGCSVWDLIMGTLATLIGAYGTYLLRDRKWLAPIPPILSNTIILPLVFSSVYGVGSYLYFLAVTGAGEILSCGVLGTVVTVILDKYKKISDKI